MEVDTDYLERYYSSLCTDALREIDRADLVGAAQKCFDKGLASRGSRPWPVLTVSMHRWTVSAPGRLNRRATSVLDRDIHKDEFEPRPKYIFCGLFDRIERVTRVYHDEISGRRSQP
jgi:hypothetical protein